MNSEQSNEQRAKSNEQRAKSNEQQATAEKFHLSTTIIISIRKLLMKGRHKYNDELTILIMHASTLLLPSLELGYTRCKSLGMKNYAYYTPMQRSVA